MSFPSRRLSIAAAIPAIGLAAYVVVLWLHPLPHAADQYLPFFHNRSLADPTLPLEVFRSVWLIGWLLVFAVVMFPAGARILWTGQRFWLGFAILAFAAILLPVSLVQLIEAVGEHWRIDGGPPAIRVDDAAITCRSEGVSVALRDVQEAHVWYGRRAQTAIVLAVAPAGEARPREVRCTTTYLDVAATDIVAAVERRRVRVRAP